MITMDKIRLEHRLLTGLPGLEIARLAEAVVRRAQCPVLTLRQSPADKGD